MLSEILITYIRTVLISTIYHWAARLTFMLLYLWQDISFLLKVTSSFYTLDTCEIKRTARVVINPAK